MRTGPYGCANLILSDWPELLQSFQIPPSALIFICHVTEIVGKGCIFETLLNFLILLNESISLSSSKSYMRGEIGYVMEVNLVRNNRNKSLLVCCLNTFKIAKSKNGLFQT